MKHSLNLYWEDIPIGSENAVDYPTLCKLWGKKEREVRNILHELSSMDNGDNFVLIRSSKKKGFYKTDNISDIEAYRKECLNKGRSVFAPVKKCNRVLNAEDGQIEMFNNLRTVRESLGMKQTTVCERMREFDHDFDAPLLSKMENSVCLPTIYQLSKLAQIYGVMPSELIQVEAPAFPLWNKCVGLS